MRRVAALAGLASLAVVASAIAGGMAGALYAAAAALALLGLLLPPALKRQRGRRSDGAAPDPPGPQLHAGVSGGRGRALPGIRRLGFVRELEARLAEQQAESRTLRERLRAESEAAERANAQLGGANELLAQERSRREHVLRRLESSLGRHSHERELLEQGLEAVQALLAAQPPRRSAGFDRAPGAAFAGPLEEGLRPAVARPTMP